MTGPHTTPPDRLVQAIEVHHAFLAAGRQDHAACLAEHPELRDLLEPMFADAASETEPDLTERTIGEYRIIREIGRGAMGIVFEAEQLSLGRLVALKLLPASAELDPRAVARFRRESALAASLDHPGITKVYGSGEHQGQHWFAMELVDGVSLASVLADRSAGKAPARAEVESAVAIAIDIASALVAAHQAGIVHRDVKPGNILIRRDGRAVLTDFGIARSDDAVALTRTGDFAGTPSYASPEQLRARPEELDQRTDIFSLGATLYEALCLTKPFDAPTLSEIRLRIERHDPKPPSRILAGIPKDLDAVVLRALEKAKHQRYQTAADLLADLQRWRDGKPVLARSTGMPVRFGRWCKRNPIAASFLATVSGGLVVVGLLALELGIKGTLAADRLVHFRAMKVERDVRLLKEAFAASPGPAPENAQALRNLILSADSLLAEIPALRAVQRQLQALGVRGGEVATGRQLTKHPMAEAAVRLRHDRDQIASRLAVLLGEGAAEAAWQSQVEARLATMDARAAQLAARGNDRRTYSFADPEVEYLHDSVEDQIAELEWFAEYHLPALRARQQRSEAVPTGEFLAAWDVAIKTAAALPVYAGLQLAAHSDLLPLGQDPDSGLLEFAHLHSGKAPRRANSGDLVYESDSAIVFVLIPGGDSWIGSQRTARSGRHYDAYTQIIEAAPVLVPLAPFFLSKHEMGHGQWIKLADGLGTWHQAAHFEGREGFERKPITCVTWDDCDRLCRASGFVLPTEAQWEHACRASTGTPWWTGETKDTLSGQENIGDPDAGRLEVDSLAANPFGLHHMHGNVQEWCREPFIEKEHVFVGPAGLRQGTADGGNMAIRGGAYTLSALHARSSNRNTSFHMDQKRILGLRPSIELRRTK